MNTGIATSAVLFFQIHTYAHIVWLPVEVENISTSNFDQKFVNLLVKLHITPFFNANIFNVFIRNKIELCSSVQWTRLINHSSLNGKWPIMFHLLFHIRSVGCISPMEKSTFKRHGNFLFQMPVKNHSLTWQPSEKVFPTEFGTSQKRFIKKMLTIKIFFSVH